MQVLRSRRGMPTALKALITVVALAAGSLGVAYVWQNSNELTAAFGSPDAGGEISGAPSVAEPSAEASAAASPSSDYEPDSPEETSGIAPPSPAEPESPGTESGGEGVNYAREALYGSVPASAPANYSYFDDAIFFGDSISTGIPLYMKTSVPNAEVVAYQGISPGVAATSECIDVDGVKMTMLEAAKLKGERKKVYVMLGANALDSDEEAFMKGYRAFVEGIREQYPEAVVYIQSILPVTSSVNDVYKSPNVNNERISQFNAAIRDMAASLGAYYVDVAQCMVDKDGFLPLEASPVDGMHLNPEYYYKWFDYLRAHTVPDKNAKD